MAEHREVRMKRAFSSLVLFSLLVVLGLACSTPSAPPQDVKEDVPHSDVADVPGDVDKPDGLPDGQPDLDNVVPDEIEQPDIKDVRPDMLDIPDEVGPDVEIPDVCVGDACAPECDMPCAGDPECVGKIDGADSCNTERCLFDAVCGSFQCKLFSQPGCCEVDNDCKDNNSCTINEKCLSDKTCTYENDDSNPDCCINKNLLNLDFEDGMMPPDSKLVMLDYFTGDKVAWGLSSAPCASKFALYLGDPDCKTYYNGQLDANCSPVEDIACTTLTQDEVCPPPNQLCDVTGTNPKNTCKPNPAPTYVKVDLTAPELNLPESALVTVTFDIWTETEPELPGAGDAFKPDWFYLFVKPAGGAETQVFTTKEMKNTDGKCITISADLSAYAGQSVDLIWRFDTQDQANNFFEGIYLDNIKVMSYCKNCNANSQCFDDDVCTSDTCNMFANKQDQGYCSNAKQDVFCKPCAGVADCQNAGPHPADEFCWPPSCEAGLCRWDPNPSCCSAVANLSDYFQSGFEAGNASNGYFLSPASGNVGWQVVDTQSYNAVADPTADNFSIYFGNPVSGTYNCGTLQCKGQFTTPYIDLTDADSNAYAKLTFQLNLSTEFDELDPNSYPPDNAHTSRIDVLFVEVVAPDGTMIKEVWNSDVVKGTTGGAWAPQWADLSDFKGQKIALRFRFDTGDINPPNNDFGGVYVDELKVETVCDAVCTGPLDCPAPSACSTATCSDGRCGTEMIQDCCTAVVNPNCDDNDPCTVDSCNVGAQTCSHSFSADPNCCTAYPKLLLDTFVSLTSEDWTLANSGALCGNGACTAEESCLTCPKDCNQCLVSWRVTDHRSSSAPYSLYFGNPANWTYANGALNSEGTIVSPALQLPPYGVPAVSFRLWLDTEHVSVFNTFVEPNDYDMLSVYVESSADGQTWGTPVLAWNSMSWDFKGSSYDPNTGSVGWKDVSFGLDTLNLGSKYVRFSLTFNSLDFSSNNYEGAYVDDFKIFTLCNQQYECLSPFECNEATPTTPACSMESCTGGKCGFDFNVLKPGCCTQTVLAGGSFDFDGPCSMEGWVANPSSDTVKWQADNFKNHTPGGQCGLYFGNATTHTYEKGTSIVAGKATSPTVDVSEHDKVQVSFWLYVDVKDLSYMLDALTFQVDYAPAPGQAAINTPVTVWSKHCSNSDDAQCALTPAGSPCDVLGCGDLALNQWVQFSFIIDFTKPEFDGWIWDNFPAKYAIFKFQFNSGDNVANDGLGVFVDDFQVKSLCQ